MEWVTILIIYLLIGAIICWKEHKLIEEAHDYAAADMPLKIRKVFKVLMVMMVIVCAPIVIIVWNMPKKSKTKK